MNELAKTFLDLRPLLGPALRNRSEQESAEDCSGVITSLYELVMRVWRKAVVGLSPRRER